MERVICIDDRPVAGRPQDIYKGHVYLAAEHPRSTLYNIHDLNGFRIRTYLKSRFVREDSDNEGFARALLKENKQ